MLLNYLKRIVCFCILFSFSIFINAQTTLTAGDIAVVGVNTDNPDEFAFVLLKDIQAGTTIYFTDSGVKADGSFRGNEGAVLYTAPTALTFGTVINFVNDGANFTAANDSNVGNNGFNLSASGDQVIAFVGSSASPTFIFAVQTNSTVFQTESSSSNDSALPTGLTVGSNAVAVGTGSGSGSEYDNSAYNLSVTSGDKAALLAAIANNANWNGSNTLISPLPANGDFAGGSVVTPTEIVVQGNSNTISNGDTTPSTTDNTDFGTSEINTTDTSEFSIENNTGAVVNVTAINITGTDAGDFSVSSSSPSLPFAVADGTPQSISIEFLSATAGSKTATLEIVTDLNTVSFSITATAIDTGAITFIHDIQGNGTTTPLSGQTVTIEGIVVGDFQQGTGVDGDLDGFFVQEEDVDADADSSTSEGIYIYEGSSPIVDVAIGDLVRITGTATEYYNCTQLSSVVTVTIVSSGNVMPTPGSVTLPAINTVVNSDGEPIPDLEQVEGMLVTLPQPLVVSELFQLDRYGEIKLTEGGRIAQFTQDNVPSTSGYANHLIEAAKRTVFLDDGFSIQNPDPIKYPDGSLGTDDALRMGDTVENLTGVVQFSRASGGSGTETYRIHPVVAPVFTSVNTRKPTPDDVGGSLKIASFNVLNYFKTIDVSGAVTANGNDPRGADTQAEFDRQREKLLNALVAIDADVFGLIEIENDFTPSSSGNAIEDLVAGLNSQLGSAVYSWVQPQTQYVGDDAIATGVIYKSASVEILAGTQVEVLTDTELTGLGIASSPAIFSGDSTNRSPIAVTFKEISSDESFTVVVTHFKSKGSAGTAGTADEDQNDGAGYSNQTRLNGVMALNTWLDSDPTGSNDADFIVLGDFNSYAKESPITYFESEGYVDVARNVLGSSAYSYVFDGQIGSLDYAFISASLASKLTGATDWHINADEADALDYNLDFSRNTTMFDGSNPYRASDHDPVIFGLQLKDVVLGVNDLDAQSNELIMYPIPARSQLNLISENIKGDVEVKVFNISGALIQSKTVNFNTDRQAELNIAQFEQGTYLLVLEGAEYKISRLFIKK